MFRSGFLLSVSGPAAVLTLLIQPTVRQAADHWTPSMMTSQTTVSVPATTVSTLGLPATRTAPIGISPTRVAAIPSSGTRPVQVPPQAGRTASDKDGAKVRRPMQEGCERAISSLAGPEARRMVPGRCMT